MAAGFAVSVAEVGQPMAQAAALRLQDGGNNFGKSLEVAAILGHHPLT